MVVVKWWVELESPEGWTPWKSKMAHSHAWQLVQTVPSDGAVNWSTYMWTLYMASHHMVVGSGKK